MAGVVEVAAANNKAAITLMAIGSVSPHRTDQRGGRAVILHGVQAEAPDDIVVGLRHIKLGVAVFIVAMALAAGRLAATVAIGNQIGLAVVGIDAGADPGCRGSCRTRRALMRAAA